MTALNFLTQSNKPAAGETAALARMIAAQNARIEAEYRRLRRADKDTIIRAIGSRLDLTHCRRESKGDLIAVAMSAMFSRRQLETWQAAR